MKALLYPYLLVGLGSAAGGIARFAVGRLVGTAPGGFPLRTFVVNVIGCFALGLLGGFLAHRASPHAGVLRLALGVGFCGGFTTFSAFAIETHNLLTGGAKVTAWVYVIASFVVGLGALRAGLAVTRWW